MSLFGYEKSVLAILRKKEHGFASFVEALI